MRCSDSHWHKNKPKLVQQPLQSFHPRQLRKHKLVQMQSLHYLPVRQLLHKTNRPQCHYNLTVLCNLYKNIVLSVLMVAREAKAMDTSFDLLAMSESCDLKDGRGDFENLMVVKKVSRGQNWGGTLSWHDNFHALPVGNATLYLSYTDVSVMNRKTELTLQNLPQEI